ncbi:hypothetical protein D3C80_2095950 [compost metagenome]
MAVRAPKKAPTITDRPMQRPMIQSTCPENTNTDSAAMLLTKFMLRATPLALTRSIGYISRLLTVQNAPVPGPATPS